LAEVACAIAEMLNPGNKELGETIATLNFLPCAACQCNAHLPVLFIFGSGGQRIFIFLSLAAAASASLYFYVTSSVSKRALGVICLRTVPTDDSEPLVTLPFCAWCQQTL